MTLLYNGPQVELNKDCFQVSHWKLAQKDNQPWVHSIEQNSHCKDMGMLG